MNKKYIIGAVAVVALVLFGVMNLRKSVTPYVGFDEAKQAKAVVQVNGKLVRNSSKFDPRSTLLTFSVHDPNGKILPVVYHKAPPANFENAAGMVLIGQYQNGAFQAENILVKCPSKYEKKT